MAVTIPQSDDLVSAGEVRQSGPTWREEVESVFNCVEDMREIKPEQVRVNRPGFVVPPLSEVANDFATQSNFEVRTGASVHRVSFPDIEGAAIVNNLDADGAGLLGEPVSEISHALTLATERKSDS
ncbi:hypothetical protein NY551_19100 [Curtobacterium flaccumfaciens pv. oortii]|uniref:hypothetical protein n=1 Tax=Curtobacterium flaccumfaciens TaxID=2035 RepID=UPI002657FFC3|nr:hypothetical protein [Curtobacterium flaccumfaciens]MCS5524849.1 hypothetical protein [Curtobacterium flaccumfaciens pv. oortii]